MGKCRGHVSVRTCVSCGAKRSKQELIRFVLDLECRPVQDRAFRMEGRGVYTCKREACVEGLENAKNKALRRFSARVSRKALPGSKQIGGFNVKSQGL